MVQSSAAYLFLTLTNPQVRMVFWEWHLTATLIIHIILTLPISYEQDSGSGGEDEDGYIDAETLGPGDSSAFQVSSFH
ncbi:hypothetical protein [Candidatus Nitrosocosmicus sp. T]